MSEYATTETEGLITIKLPEIVDGKEGTPLEALIKSWLLSPAKGHVLDFSAVTEFRQTSYRLFVLYNQSLKGAGKSLFAIGIPTKIASQIRAEGLQSVFIQVANLDEAKKKSGGERVVLDVEFINPFIVATRTVLETQAQTKLAPGKAYLKKGGEQIPMEIAGVLSLVSKDFRGSISLCFRAEVFLKVYENMVGEKHPAITSELEDAAGELLNIIFGQAKTVLNDQKGYALEKALPTILVGERLKLRHQSRNPAIVIPFDSAAGTFHVEIVIDRS